MTLSCIIVDDEPLAVRLLETFVQKTPGLKLLASYTDSVEALPVIKDGQANLVFLDIQMPDLDGMELARTVPPQTRIIFTTAFKEYAFESYEVSALDFLLKPIRYSKFETAVEKARQWFEHVQVPPSVAQQVPESTIFLRIDGELRQVALDSVLYVSGLKDYVMFYIEGEHRPLVTHLTMKSVEEMLPAQQFMRVHRSYIVALSKIRSIDRNDCIYIGDEVIRVSDSYRDAFQHYLNTRLPGGH